MQTVILAGGYGSRISEETVLKPKPMIEIGGKPILWHIMKTYSFYGHNKFIICLGYKSEIIKKYFIDFLYNNNDIKISTSSKKIEIFKKKEFDKWTVSLIDTGLHTKTAERIKKISSHINSPNFFMTYGDGLGNININKLYEFHKKNNKSATVTAVKPLPRFGKLNLSRNQIIDFKEKKTNSTKELINGGFFVLNKKIFKIIKNFNNLMWEDEPMDILTKEKELVGYYHKDFWHPIDTLRDKKYLEDLWIRQKAPWKIWD